MIKVDWSEAPEGATHYFHGSSTPWRDLSGEKWKWFSGNSWHCSGYPSSEIMDDYSDRMTEKPSSAWSGEGLPPVGTVCEFAGGTPCPEDPFDKDLREGMQVTIIAHFKCGDFTLAAFTFNPENPDRGMVQVEQGNYRCFRPIRTPEQIAAEERLHEIRNACTAISNALSRLHESEEPTAIAIIEAMIDEGYRKQDAK